MGFKGAMAICCLPTPVRRIEAVSESFGAYEKKCRKDYNHVMSEILQPPCRKNWTTPVPNTCVLRLLPGDPRKHLHFSTKNEKFSSYHSLISNIMKILHLIV